MSFVGSNCLLKLPSSSNQADVKKNTIVEVIVIKTIDNNYVAPFLNRPDGWILVNSVLQ